MEALTDRIEKIEKYLESLSIHVGRIEDQVTYLLLQHGLGYLDKQKPKLSQVKGEDGDA